MRPRRSLKAVAIIIGGIFVLIGITALIGDPDAADGVWRAGKYSRALQTLREALGDPGGGIAMIGLGLVLGGFLYWAAGRRG